MRLLPLYSVSGVSMSQGRCVRIHIEEFKVERWINVAELHVRYNLAETDAKPFTLEEILSLGDREALTRQIMGLRLGYNPTTGSDLLRDAIAKMYDNTGAEQVLVTTGAIEADFLLANVLVEPGDTVIVQFPAYQVLHSVARARGANIKAWKMRFDEGYEPDLDRLASLVDDRTKLLVLNNPHNPTGAVITRESLETILGWAEERGFWVLCDEVYHGLSFEEGLVAPYARSLSPRGISVGSLSKTFGLSGLRLGWIAGPEDLLDRCWSWKDYTSISNSPISDFLAHLAVSNVDKVWERNRAIARHNVCLLMEALEALRPHVAYVKPKAGLVCFPRFHLPVSTEDLCRRAIDEKSLLLVPGECFDMPGYVRIGFGGDTGGFAAGLRELASLIREIAG